MTSSAFRLFINTIRTRRKIAISLFLLGVMTPLLTGCTINPATGKQDFTPLMSPEKEKAVGQSEHPKLLEALGGVYQDSFTGQAVGGDLGLYVAQIGGRLASHSELPASHFTFTVLDSPTINAMALPGGYVYVTRGLIAHANSEAELAGVLAHEIGHVTARHAAQRYNKSVATSVGAAVLGAIMQNRQASELLNVGANLYLSSFSREQEFEADLLGVRYLARAGYDPHAEADFLSTLLAEKELMKRIHGDNASERSAFFSTHPNTADRVRRAIEAAGENGAMAFNRPRRRAEFLDQIDGIMYGSSPAEGYARGRHFNHPEIGFGFTVPEGFRLINTSRAVIAKGPGDAAIIFDGDDGKNGDRGGSMLTYLTNSWAKGAALEGGEEITINGMDAATATTTGRAKSGAVDIRLVAIRFEPGKIFRFMMASPQGQTAKLQQAYQRTTYSFHRLTKAEIRKLHPLRIKLLRTTQGKTTASYAPRMKVDDFKADIFRVLNGLHGNREPEAGSRVKIVVD